MAGAMNLLVAPPKIGKSALMVGMIAAWWQGAPENVRDHVRRYYGISGNDVVWDLVRSALASVACFAIVPMQDLLELDNRARMNTPSVAEGNWGWRLRPGDLTDGVAARVRALSTLYGRA